jgi:hypothetical protein
MLYLMTLKLPQTMVGITLLINNRFEVSLTSNLRHVLNTVCLLLGNSDAVEISSLPARQKESKFCFVWFESHLQRPNWHRPAF